MVAGIASDRAVVARLTGDGALDPTFGSGGLATLSDPAPIDVHKMLLEPGGKIVIVGHVTANQREGAIARLR